MARNLDMTALRSFVAVADSGGVTKAAGFLNLTQSAVSMQLKRLEESLNVALLDRSARTIGLTPAGEQLVSYARRMLALNDEAYGKLTAVEYEGEITLGVPHDIIYPVIPGVLQRFAAAYPRVKVHLVSSFTNGLLDEFSRGQMDLILTTEDGVQKGGETMASIPLLWVGAPNGQAWKRRPLRLAHEHRCAFRQFAQRRLDEAGIPWEMAVETDNSRAVEATVSADLAVHTMLEGTEPRYVEPIDHGGALPSLLAMNVNLYMSDQSVGPVLPDLAEMLRSAYRKAPATVMA